MLQACHIVHSESPWICQWCTRAGTNFACDNEHQHMFNYPICNTLELAHKFHSRTFGLHYTYIHTYYVCSWQLCPSTPDITYPNSRSFASIEHSKLYAWHIWKSYSKWPEQNITTKISTQACTVPPGHGSYNTYITTFRLHAKVAWRYLFPEILDTMESNLLLGWWQKDGIWLFHEWNERSVGRGEHSGSLLTHFTTKVYQLSVYQPVSNQPLATALYSPG